MFRDSPKCKMSAECFDSAQDKAKRLLTSAGCRALTPQPLSRWLDGWQSGDDRGAGAKGGRARRANSG